MSSEVKRVKILTLIELFLGLALLVLGLVSILGGALTTSPYLVLGEGLVTVVFGVRGALIANVPARIGKLFAKALILALVQIVCVAGVVYITGTDNVSKEPLMAVAACVPIVFSLAIALLSRGIAKRAER